MTTMGTANVQISLCKWTYIVVSWMFTTSRYGGEFWVQVSLRHHLNYKQMNKQHWDTFYLKLVGPGLCSACPTNFKCVHMRRLWVLKQVWINLLQHYLSLPIGSSDSGWGNTSKHLRHPFHYLLHIPNALQIST